MRLLILDACRNKPLARSPLRTAAIRSVSGGSFGDLNDDLLGDATLVAYAAAAGTTAVAGRGRNSPSALLANLVGPQELSALFRRVRAHVLKATTGEQRPHEYASLPREHYLPGASVPGTVVVADDAGVDVRPQGKTVFWRSIANSADPADFRAYLKETGQLNMTVEIDTIAPGILRYVSPEQVVFFVAKDTNVPPATERFPTNGGLRIQTYPNEEAAIHEAAALAERMTRKHLLYNTGFGGVKIVVCAPPHELDKRALLNAVAQVLQIMAGQMYTGGDLNTTDQDMHYLSRQSPYVLAGIGSDIRPDEATASGVYGAILGVLGHDYIRNNRFLVHGLGKVGSAVAERLMASGANVLGYDMVPGRAEHPGFRNVSDNPTWWNESFDVFVPCSASNVITVDIARRLSCAHIIGSANKPFSDTPAVVDLLAERKIFWVPDVISSAGAVISDSIEYYAPDIFRTSKAEAVYGFVARLIGRMSRHVLTKYEWGGGMAMNDILNSLVEPPPSAPVCGLAFQSTEADISFSLVD